MLYYIKITFREECFPLKKYFGFLVAAISLGMYFGMTALAKRYGALLDTFYPYVSRWGQKILSAISSIFPFTLWQVLAVALVLLCLGTLIWVIWKKKSFIRWLGWVLAIVSLGWTTHTGIYGLNFYASALVEDIRLETVVLTQEDLENALIYFRDQANELALQLPRDAEGNLIYDDFTTLSQKAGDGYKNLTREGYAVFSGSTAPVKKLAWANMYSAMGICGVSMALTGEASVHPLCDVPRNVPPHVHQLGGRCQFCRIFILRSQ